MCVFIRLQFDDFFCFLFFLDDIVFCFLGFGNFVVVLGFGLFIEKELKIRWVRKRRRSGQTCGKEYNQNIFKFKIKEKQKVK